MHIGNQSASAAIFSAPAACGRIFRFDCQVKAAESTLIPAGEIGSYTRMRIILRPLTTSTAITKPYPTSPAAAAT